MEEPDREKAHEFWRKSSAASQIQEVIDHGDDIQLLDLLARVGKGEKVIEADQQEDAEYFKCSTVIQGILPE